MRKRAEHAESTRRWGGSVDTTSAIVDHEGEADGGNMSGALAHWIFTLLAAAALFLPPLANAGLADEQALAERYAPVVRLVEQAHECGSGESYEPIDVDVLFDEPTVALRGPWGRDLVKIAPAAADLTADRYEYHLDFPGNALHRGATTSAGRAT